MELYLPPQNAKLKTNNPFYKATETFKRRSEASRRSAIAYWSDKRHHKRVDKNAKAVDVFDMQGHYLSTYPSARKAAVALGFPHLENSIRAVRRGDQYKKSVRGFMFRDAAPVKADIDPYAKKKKKQPRGYHKDNSYLRKPVRLIFPDGETIDFPSINDCAAALGRVPSSVNKAVYVQFIENQQNKLIS